MFRLGHHPLEEPYLERLIQTRTFKLDQTLTSRRVGTKPRKMSQRNCNLKSKRDPREVSTKARLRKARRAFSNECACHPRLILNSQLLLHLRRLW